MLSDRQGLEELVKLLIGGVIVLPAWWIHKKISEFLDLF